MNPAPSHSGQILGWVPGLPPVPWQSGHAASEVSRRLIVTPSSASMKPMVALLSTSAPADRSRAAPLATAPAAEDVAEQVAEAARAVAEQVTDVEARAVGRRTAGEATAEPTAAVEVADLVVLLPLLLVADDVVRLGDGLELLVLGGVARVRVGVVGARELAVGLLDVGLGRLLVHTQHGVVVLRRPVGAHSGLAHGSLPSPVSSSVVGLAADPAQPPAGSTTSTCAARTTRSPMR